MKICNNHKTITITSIHPGGRIQSSYKSSNFDATEAQLWLKNSTYNV